MASPTSLRGRIVLQPRVTVDEFAVAIRKHPETIRRLYRSGAIKGASVGGTITFAAEDVEKFLIERGIDNVVMLEASA